MSLMCHEVGCSSSGGGAVLALRSPHAVCPCHPALPLRPNPSPNPSPPTLPQVRTPLNGCLASAEMLLDTQLDEDQRELAKTIRVSGSILHSTVSNFLDYFKMGEGRADPAACTFAVAVVRCWGGREREEVAALAQRSLRDCRASGNGRGPPPQVLTFQSSWVPAGCSASPPVACRTSSPCLAWCQSSSASSLPAAAHPDPPPTAWHALPPSLHPHHLLQRPASLWTLCVLRWTWKTWSPTCTASLRRWWAATAGWS